MDYSRLIELMTSLHSKDRQCRNYTEAAGTNLRQNYNFIDQQYTDIAILAEYIKHFAFMVYKQNCTDSSSVERDELSISRRLLERDSNPFKSRRQTSKDLGNWIEMVSRICIASYWCCIFITLLQRDSSRKRLLKKNASSS
ncbi:hypothetical protein NPIL_545981 [Nephila pilipes]|uniref:Uncharacterized protein n=1 Tax=Nephila pilipes TaxID=299642 RepID=A0A8X6TBL2_NEPPI|nr:hypothetical protein NPIL_545981 [Nephila pilipes]